MPTWVGFGFVALQKEIVITGPGGASLYRLLWSCSACNSKGDYTLGPGDPVADLARALGRVAEHYTDHLK